jgi:hypothetical protein
MRKKVVEIKSAAHNPYPWILFDVISYSNLTYKLNSMVWVRERTIPTERPPLVVEVITNFYG